MICNTIDDNRELEHRREVENKLIELNNKLDRMR
jgi:hypothetical protein